ncbi:MAG: S41 family peptidase [Glycocaulis sp.]
MLKAFSSAACAVAALSTPSFASDPDWREVYLADLAAIRTTIETQHPGPVDTLNPAFSSWLDEGYERALGRADQVDSQLAYFYGLSAFVDGFRDGHLGLSYNLDNPYFAWPGFVAAWRGGEVIVLDADPSFAGAPPAGAQITACDGRPVRDWIHARVFDFMMNPDLPGDWYRAVPRAFLSRGNPLAPLPASCTFVSGGEARDIALDWQITNAQTYMAAFRAGGFGEANDLGMTQIGEHRYWISLPTFGPDGDLAETMAVLADDMRERAETYRNAELVVFDLRGNTGGSSMWGDAFDTALFGGRVEQTPDETYVDWRVTQENRDHIADAADGFILEQFGEDSDAMRWARRIIAGMDEALANGDALWTQRSDPADLPPEDSLPPAELTARVVVLTDGYCASACLDFMDRLMDRPGVIHVGAPTSADTDYMEVRTITLPSGAARLTFALKVYRGRPRGSGVYYVPDIVFDGQHWTTQALNAWVNGLYESGQLDR